MLFVVLTVTATLNQGLDLGRAVLDHAVRVDPARVADPPAIREAIRQAATVVALIHVVLLGWWTAVYRPRDGGPGRAATGRIASRMTVPRPWILRALLLAPLLPLAAGQRMVTYQDAMMTHLPAKAATVEQVRQGTLPYLNPYASFGEPLAGNPNFGTFFPDMLAFLILPLPMAFGLRFALAAVLAYAGARRWARAEGATRAAAEVAAAAFALSGVYVSTWRFFNSGLALALAPWVMAAAARLGGGQADPPVRWRRTVAELALVSGLEILAGEPVIALMTFGLALLRVLVGRSGRRAMAGAAAGLALGAALAAPQIASTAQVYATSTRSLAPFPYLLASSTSLTSARLLEQVTAFPFGRPDLTGESGFTGHAHYDNHAPYLWTLHVGWVVLAVLLLWARPRDATERWWWALLATSVILSFGRSLPGAKWLHPVVSLGGRMRFPVKWWYVAALILVPLVAHAASRWDAGTRPSVPARGRAALAATIGLGLLVAAAPPSGIAALAAGASVLGVVLLIVRPPSAEGLAWMVAGTLALSNLPLWRTLVDVPPDLPPRFAGGRIYERAAGDAHPRPNGPEWPPPEKTDARDLPPRSPRAVGPHRRARRNALRLRRRSRRHLLRRRPRGGEVDRRPALAPARRPAARGGRGVCGRPRRAAALRSSASPCCRRSAASSCIAWKAGRRRCAWPRACSPPSPSRTSCRGCRGRTSIRSRTPWSWPPTRRQGLRSPPRRRWWRRRARACARRVSAPAPALVVWSRTFFRAWRARVDGTSVAVVVADGHLVGVPVPPGAHDVEISWSRTPVVVGGLVSLAALAMVVLGCGGAESLSRRGGATSRVRRRSGEM